MDRIISIIASVDHVASDFFLVSVMSNFCMCCSAFSPNDTDNGGMFISQKSKWSTEVEGDPKAPF